MSTCSYVWMWIEINKKTTRTQGLCTWLAPFVMTRDLDQRPRGADILRRIHDFDLRAVDEELRYVGVREDVLEAEKVFAGRGRLGDGEVPLPMSEMRCMSLFCSRRGTERFGSCYQVKGREGVGGILGYTYARDPESSPDGFEHVPDVLVGRIVVVEGLLRYPGGL